MMEPVAISWLVASATSPLMAVLSLWTVYVFHTYRKRWRTVDLFLLAVASQELVSSVFIFGYAIVSLVNPEIPALCSFVQWGLVAVRTFQMATLASMVVDRALTVRWPYRYRFSVRRNQIRYHVAVLALTSALVGVASVFAHNNNGVQQPNLRPEGMRVGVCSSHPLAWDFKFVVFLLAFHGVLLLVSLVCTVHIEALRCRNGGHEKGRPFQIPDCSSDLPVPTSVTSPLDNESHTGSTRALHRPYRQSSRRPYFNKESKGTVSMDFRWPPVAIVSLVCFSINHLPYLVLSSLATAVPRIWSPWHETLLSWLRLAEAIAVPLVLCLVDRPLRSALRRTFQRRSGALSPLAGDDGPFQMYFDKDHFRKRGTFGSVTPIGIITNYRRTPGKKRRSRGGSKCKYKLPGLQSGDSVLTGKKNAFLTGIEPLSKLSCADLTNLEVWREEEEEYLSDEDGFSTFSGDSAVFHGDGDDMYDDEAKMCCGDEDVYGGSFTTIANDDFEFHDTRPCGGEVRMKPGLPPPTPLDEQPPRFGSALRSKTSTGFYIKEKPFEIEDMIKKSASTEKFCDLMNLTVPLFPDQEDKKDPDLIRSSHDSKSPPATLSKATSFSMNDLDLIDDTGSGEERLYVLPVKSESTLSLYRLHLESKGVMPPILLPITKSENNINGDSGYGTQTVFNPIWPAHRPPPRKVSDPLANCRKQYRQRSPDPMNVHPKMQRLPWISAWRKLGENADSSGRNSNDSHQNTNNDQEVSTIDNNFELRQKDPFQWKDSVVYSSNVLCYKEGEDGIVYTHIQPENYVSGEGVCCKKIASKVVKKGSFKDVGQNDGSYGKIKNSQQRDNSAVTENTEEKFHPPENIYEEIIHGKPVINIRTPLKGKIRNSDVTSEDISYAQTDIINFSGNDNIVFPSQRSQDFTLNINIRPLPEVNTFNANEFLLTNTSGAPNYNVSYASDANFNVCVDQMVKPKLPKFSAENSWRNDNNVSCNTKPNAIYGANNTAVGEFANNVPDNIQFRVTYDGRKETLADFDSNSNSLQKSDQMEKFNKNSLRNSKNLCDRKVHQSDNTPVQRSRQANHKIKRRESSGRGRKGRFERIESSDDQQIPNSERFYSVAERELGGKGSSSSSPKRRESDSKKARRPKRSRTDSCSGRDGRKIINPVETADYFRSDRNEGLWNKASPARHRHVPKAENYGDEDPTSFKVEESTVCVKDLHSVEVDKVDDGNDVCLELAEVPSIVAAKELYDRNNLWRRHSRSRKDDYWPGNENNLNSTSHQQHHRRRPLIRSGALDIPENQQHVPLANVRVFGAVDAPSEASRQRAGRIEVEHWSRDNGVSRRKSGNENLAGRIVRRSSVDLETTTEQEKSKRIRRSESDQKRNASRDKRKITSATEGPCANGNFGLVLEQADLMNRNVDGDDQQLQMTKRGEMGMDYLVYGRQRDNDVPGEDSTEVSRLEASVQQPLRSRRNLVKERHGVEKQTSELKEKQRNKQKKIAVTDFL